MALLNQDQIAHHTTNMVALFAPVVSWLFAPDHVTILVGIVSIFYYLTLTISQVIGWFKKGKDDGG